MRTAPIALLLAVIAAGCGGTVLDRGDAEDLARTHVAADPERGDVRSAECPDDIEPKAGESFDCTVETERGPLTVTITMSDVTDEQVGLQVMDVRAG